MILLIWLTTWPVPLYCILSGFKYYVLTSKNKYNVLIVFRLYCKTLLLLLRCDTGKVRLRCGGMGRIKGVREGKTVYYKCNYIN